MRDRALLVAKQVDGVHDCDTDHLREQYNTGYQEHNTEGKHYDIKRLMGGASCCRFFVFLNTEFQIVPLP